MLAKLSLLLGFFVAVSLGQTPDCRMAPPTKAICCSSLPDYNSNDATGECLVQYKSGVEPFQPSCDHITCIMKKNDHLVTDNKIDRAAFTKFVQQNLTQFSPNIETSLEKCYISTETSKCTPQAFLFCVMTVLMKECPSASWAKTDECTALKTFYDNCPNAAILTY